MDVIKFLEENPIQYIATVDNNGHPRVRPFQFMLEKDGKLFFCTSNQKKVYKELENNPNIELSITSPNMSWIRLSGRAVFVDDLEVKNAILKKSELVKSIYQKAENPIFEAFYLKDVKAIISDFSGNPPKEYSL